MFDALNHLVKLIRDRKVKPIDGSYTNKLLKDSFLPVTLHSVEMSLQVHTGVGLMLYPFGIVIFMS